jgi:hypothetical protein
LVSWGPAASDGGSPIAAYGVIALQGGRVVGWVNTGPFSRTATVSGLPSGTDVSVEVVASDGRGFDTASSVVTVHIT